MIFILEFIQLQLDEFSIAADDRVFSKIRLIEKKTGTIRRI